METRGQEKSFGPVFGPSSRALILGSYPSPKSFDEGFYYGHPQNRFWPLLAALCSAPVPLTIEDKKTLLLRHNLALWDVLERCDIQGASDLTIRNPVPNDIAALVRRGAITAIFCNGAAAHTLYRRYCQKDTGIEALRLPSTSPANAAFSLPRLLEAWQPLKASIGG